MQQAPRSGLAQAGGILLLIGAILAALSVFLMLGMFAMMTWMGNTFADEPGMMGFPGFMAWMYLGFGVLSVGGAIVGFIAWSRQREGDLRGAGILGIVASLLPPVQTLILVGAILCMVSPEAQRAKQGWQAQAP